MSSNESFNPCTQLLWTTVGLVIPVLFVKKTLMPGFHSQYVHEFICISSMYNGRWRDCLVLPLVTATCEFGISFCCVRVRGVTQLRILYLLKTFLCLGREFRGVNLNSLTNVLIQKEDTNILWQSFPWLFAVFVGHINVVCQFRGNATKIARMFVNTPERFLPQPIAYFWLVHRVR